MSPPVARRSDVIKAGDMKNSNGFLRQRRPRTSSRRRTQLLAAFDRSGLSAAAFARQEGLCYTTFCAWRSRRPKPQASPAFVEVEMPAQAATTELCIEVGTHARLRLTSASQIELAVGFLHRFNALTSC